MDIFTSGTQIGIEEILANKDWRVEQLEKLNADFPKHSLVSVKLNIPGPVKNNEYFQEIFITGWNEISKQALKAEQYSEKSAGPEGFLVFAEATVPVKKRLIAFEESFPLGRLFDLDVYQNMKQISRSDLNLPSRSCFICGLPAKECAHAERHTPEEIKAFINQKFENYFKDDFEK
jgi:holo-ACP synthase CitX